MGKSNEGNFISRAFYDVVREYDIKQVDIANKTGLPTSQISNIFNGKSEPSIHTILKICNAIDIKPEVFMFKASKEKDILDFRKRGLYSEYNQKIGNIPKFEIVF